MSPRAAAAALIAAAVAVLAGCSSTPSTPAPQASSAACTAAMAKAPATLMDHAAASAKGINTRAWGDPVMTLRCGLTAQVASPLPCLNVDDVDWVVNPDVSPMTAVSFGTDPAVELTVPTSYDRQTLPGALVDLAPVAQALPQNGHHCS